ncbi:hypothetical protein ZMO02_07590 [Zymomonas mobilis subsp. pomaceae]|uniref:hypothetical protein n=1 Tax=Zymomonas mobilis TaxID=542 RepID=UPI00116CDF45|nr:hypothetical protein [Zymomonas mobilis]GEB89122.1 hypothetical protein ZMO02_07590 [Zymomonas mobilis subsp. pomaceae]
MLPLLLIGHILLLAATPVLLSLMHYKSSIIEITCHWDCHWYAAIAKGGYITPLIEQRDPGQDTWAFFPLFPLAVRFLSKITHLDIETSALWLNACLLPLLILATMLYAKAKNILYSAPLFCLFFLIFPLGIWYRIQYSECLYGLLLMMTLYFMQKGSIQLASIPAFLLTACRPTGMIISAVIAFFHFISAFTEPDYSGSTFHSDKKKKISFYHCLCTSQKIKALIESSSFFIISASGLAFYMIYLHQITGDAMAFSHVQIGWHRYFANPIHHLIHDIHAHHHGFALDVFALAGVALIIWGFFKGQWLESLLLTATAILSLSTGINSIHRIIFANPLAIILCWQMITPLSRPIRNTLFSIMLLSDVILTIVWLHGSAFLA